MNLTMEDHRLPEKLCGQLGISTKRVVKLPYTFQDYDFKERRIGVYDFLRVTLKSEARDKR